MHKHTERITYRLKFITSMHADVRTSYSICLHAYTGRLRAELYSLMSLAHKTRLSHCRTAWALRAWHLTWRALVELHSSDICILCTLPTECAVRNNFTLPFSGHTCYSSCSGGTHLHACMFWHPNRTTMMFFLITLSAVSLEDGTVRILAGLG